MKATPMIFNRQMVQAILREIAESGTGKRMTRRILSIRPSHGWEFGTANEKGIVYGTITSPHPLRGKFGIFIRREMHPESNKFEHSVIPCPYGKPGDLIYVRETMRVVGTLPESLAMVCYEADGALSDALKWPDRLKEKPTLSKRLSNGGPREYSRITLEITSVRVELLQDISEEDAKAEGIAAYNGGWTNGALGPFSHPVLAFSDLWDSIYSNWNENPWVWVIEFKPHLVNVDAFIKQLEAA
jgi:hypothetical protein